MTGQITITWQDAADFAADIGATLQSDSAGYVLKYGRTTYVPVNPIDARAFLFGIQAEKDK